jgi:DNA-binding Lrp family transcriptional regulator
MQMDKTDSKLLSLLLENSRTPITALAHRLRISREVAQYRLDRLEKQGIIKSFFAEINLERLGYIGAAFFLVVKGTHYNELQKYVENEPYVSWAAEWSGNYSIGMTLIGKSLTEIDKHVRTILNKFGDAILSHQFILHRKNTFFYEKYFSESIKNLQKPNLNKSQKKQHKIDDLDLKLLQHLSKDSRISAVDLALELKMSAVGVAKRIHKLEDSNFISKYSIFIDITKLGIYQYSIFIDSRELHDLTTLKAYLSAHPSINFIAEYVGDQFFEFGVFVKDPYALKKILLEIEQTFPHYTFTRIALLQREFVSTGPPKEVFE